MPAGCVDSGIVCRYAGDPTSVAHKIRQDQGTAARVVVGQDEFVIALAAVDLPKGQIIEVHRIVTRTGVDIIGARHPHHVIGGSGDIQKKLVHDGSVIARRQVVQRHRRSVEGHRGCADDDAAHCAVFFREISIDFAALRLGQRLVVGDDQVTDQAIHLPLIPTLSRSQDQRGVGEVDLLDTGRHGSAIQIALNIVSIRARNVHFGLGEYIGRRRARGSASAPVGSSNIAAVQELLERKTGNCIDSENTFFLQGKRQVIAVECHEHRFLRAQTRRHRGVRQRQSSHGVGAVEIHATVAIDCVANQARPSGPAHVGQRHR